MSHSDKISSLEKHIKHLEAELKLAKHQLHLLHIPKQKCFNKTPQGTCCLGPIECQWPKCESHLQ